MTYSYSDSEMSLDWGYAPKGMDDDAYQDLLRQQNLDSIYGEESGPSEDDDELGVVEFDECDLRKLNRMPTIDDVTGKIEKRRWYYYNYHLFPIKWTVVKELGDGEYDIEEFEFCCHGCEPPAGIWDMTVEI